MAAEFAVCEYLLDATNISGHEIQRGTLNKSFIYVSTV